MAEEKKDDAQPDDAGEQETKPTKSHTSLFLVIGIIVLALAGGIGTYILLAGGKGGAPEAKKEDEKKEMKSALIALDSFVLNLAEQGRFLKVTMQFELADAASQPLVTDKMPQMRDAIITLMGSKSVESFSSAEGKLQLKDELILRANQAVGKEVFKNLYFTEFVMQ